MVCGAFLLCNGQIETQNFHKLIGLALLSGTAYHSICVYPSILELVVLTLDFRKFEKIVLYHMQFFDCTKSW